MVAQLLPWADGDLTHLETGALQALISLWELAPDLGAAVAQYPWVADGVDRDEEYSSLFSLAAVAGSDVELGRRAAPLVAGGAGRDEVDALYALDTLARWDTGFTGQALQRLTSRGRDLDRYLLQSLSRIADSYPEDFERLTTRPWFTDGLNDEEMALSVALETIRSTTTDDAYTSRDLFNDLIRSYFMQSVTVSLPQAGDVNIWVFQTEPFPPGEDLPAVIGDTARLSERLLGASFPTTDVILLVGTSVIGSHAHSYMQLPRGPDGVRFLPHETAHYYLLSRSSPPWFAEGGANFIEAYVRDRTGVESFKERRALVSQRVQEVCKDNLGLANIQQLVDFLPDANPGFGLGQSERDKANRCVYEWGELLLTEFFETFGEETAGAALGGVYELYEARGRLASEADVYEVFLANAPSGSEERVRELYRRVHGGPFTAPLPDPVPVQEPLVSRIAEALSWAGDPPDDHHARVLESLAALWRIDAGLGATVAQYSWVADGVYRIEAAAVSDLAGITAIDPEMGRLVAGYPWVIDYPGFLEQSSLNSLLRLRTVSPSGRLAASYAWVADHIRNNERRLLGLLASAAEARPGVAMTLLTLPWASDSSSLAEEFSRQDALEALARIALQDGEALRQTLALPWLADGLNEDEESVLGVFAEVAEADAELFKDVVGLPWVEDGIDAEEGVRIAHLSHILREDRGLGRRVAGFTWFIDGVDDNESIGPFAGLAEHNPALANRMVDYGWIVDGLDRNESLALSNLSRTARVDPALAGRVAGYSWVADGMGANEPSTLQSLRAIAVLDATLASGIAAYAWFTDGITGGEFQATLFLFRIVRENVELSQRIAGYTWVADGIIEAEVTGLRHLDRIAQSDLVLAEQVAGYPWVVDGISQEEAERLASLAAQ